MVFGIRAPRSTSSASPSDSASRAFGKERGFTQVELAEKIGVIQSIVSALERDERKLSAEMAVRFAHALGVSFDELLGPGQAGKRRTRRTTGRFCAGWN
jgi:transcriptional regulator with XRE-family HTH domain